MKKSCAFTAIISFILAMPGRAQQLPFDAFDATIPQIRAALTNGTTTCRQLVQYYFDRMDALDIAGPKLNAIRARNPRALQIADAYDKMPSAAKTGPLFCVPMVVKDNIDTLDMPTTAGSVALANTFSLDDSFVVKQLKAAGAIVIAKANLTEFANFLTTGMPSGYSSLGGYVLDPYDPRAIPTPLTNSDGRQALAPGGSSSGPAVVSAANLAAAAVGTETSGSILSPASANSDVGLKPTVGLISRFGIVPISASQDTAGPIARTVTDAAIVLGAMTGVDGRDSATVSSQGNAFTDYTPFLKADALHGARIGIARQYWSQANAEQNAIGDRAFQAMRMLGAEVFDVTIGSFDQLNAFSSSVLNYEFKRDLNAYLATRGPSSPIKSLADVIAYNDAHKDAALKYGQVLALQSQALDLYAAEPKYVSDRATDLQLAKVQGIDATMDQNNLTALVFPSNFGAGIAAKAGYPSITVPGGYLSTSAALGITFTGKAYSEPALIGLAFAFEQTTKYRQSPGSALRILPMSSSIQLSQVLNYASGVSGAVAPGEMIAITGSGLGPVQVVGLTLKSNNQVDTSTGGTRVLFDGIPAPILSVRADQVVAVVPYGVSGKKSTQVYVEANGQRSASLTVAVTDLALGIFNDQPLGKGQPLILNGDGTRNSPSNPAMKGSVITFFATGEGIPSTLPIDGRIPGAPLQLPGQPVVIGLNGAGIQVLYAGAAPGYVGEMQINAQLDPNEPSGTLALVVQVGSQFSAPVNLYVQ